jgi:hypothetical protein
MPTRLRGVLAALPVLLVLVLAPGASAHCGLIDAYVLNGKVWYSANDAPPTVLFDMADDEGTARDFMNETTASWLSAAPSGAFGFTTTPAWNTYAIGANSMRVALHCASGLQEMRTIVRYDPIRPTAGWSAPNAGQWLRGTVTITASGSDGQSGIGSFALALPGGSVASNNGSALFDTTSAADGTLILSAVSVDNVGNRSDPVTRVVKIDNGAPTVSLDPAGNSGFVSASSIVLAASSGDAQSGVSQVRFEGRAGSTGAWQALGGDSEAPYRLTIETPALEGGYEVRAIATDAVGNEAASPAGTLVIDRVAPAASLNALQPLVSGTIGLGAVASDSGSGVAHADFQVAPAGSDDWQTIATDDAAPWSARLATTGLTDGAYGLRVLVRDAAGNETLSALRATVVRNSLAAPAGSTAPPATQLVPGTPVAAGASAEAAKKGVTLAARALPHRVEGGHPIVVAGTAKGLSRGVVVITLQNARRPSLVQRVRTTTKANGRFRISFRPRFSGRVRVRFAGDATHRAAAADAGIARVHPRLIVSITATRAANGSLENPHVHGRLVPAGGPVRVVWQARPAHGGAWLLFCRTADQLAVGRNGVIDGTCHVTGLNPGNRYRLVVLGDAGASYLPAATKGMVARPTA